MTTAQLTVLTIALAVLGGLAGYGVAFGHLTYRTSVREIRCARAQTRALYWALGYDDLDLLRMEDGTQFPPLPPPDLDRARRLYDGLQEDVYRKGLRDLAAREDGNR